MEWGPALRGGFEHWRGFDAELRFYGTAAFMVAVLIFAWLREHKKLPWFVDRLRDKRTPKVGKPKLWEQPFRDEIIEPLDIGGVTVDFFEQHLDILALSGGYKTTLMACLARQRLKKGRPVVVVTGGQSPALEEEIRGWGGWVIYPHQAPMTFNAWDGDPLFVAQGWAELLPTSSEIKVIQSCFQLAVLDYLESQPERRVGCSRRCAECRGNGMGHDGLARFVLSWQPAVGSGVPTQRLGAMKESYGLRLLLLDKVFGDWIGTELSIAQAIRQGIPLMFVLDASTDPDFNRFSTVLVWWAVLYAVSEVGGFDVFVDELARLGLSEKLLVEQIRTFRVNDVHFIGGTHAADDLKGAMSDLIQLHAFGRMTSTAIKTRAHGQAATYNVVPMSNFGRHNLRKGEFVVVDHEDRISLARIPTYRKLPNPWRPLHPKVLPTYRQSGMNHGTGDGTAAHRKTAAVPRAVSVPVDSGTAVPEVLYGPPELPRWASGPNAERKLEIYRRFKSTPLVGCWLTSHAGKGRDRQRPGCQYRGKNWNVSDLVKALDDCAVLRLDEPGEVRYLTALKLSLADKVNGASVQHDCHNPQCVRAEHLDWLSKPDNIAEYWDHKRAGQAAD